MTDATLLATIKAALTNEWKILAPFVRDGRGYAHLRDRHEAALMALDTLAKRVSALGTIVDDMVDNDPCSYDHHGYCQTHGWFETDPPCPHARAKKLLPLMTTAPTQPMLGEE